MGTSTWGPHLWYTIHFIALGYPKNPNEQDKQAYRNFFTNLHLVIPCKRCSNNYMQNLADLPIEPYLNNNETLFEWTVLLHNTVNKELGKPEWPVKQAKQYYIKLLENNSSFKEGCDSKKKDLDSYVIMCIAIISMIMGGAIIFFIRHRLK